MIGITFKGIHSSTYNLLMKTQKFDILPTPKKIEIEIPGRNSVIDYTDGTLDDMEFIVLFQFKDKNRTNMKAKARQIASWLHTPLLTRADLVFDDDPTMIYKAKVSNRVSLEEIIRNNYKFTVTFTATPPNYLEI